MQKVYLCKVAMYRTSRQMARSHQNTDIVSGNLSNNVREQLDHSGGHVVIILSFTSPCLAIDVLDSGELEH